MKMRRRTHKKADSRTKVNDYVVAVFVEDEDLAKDFESLLHASEIPVKIVENEATEAQNAGFSVMVPEEYLDEAHVIIESQDAYDDFYDSNFEDEMDDFDEDFLDEDY
jgi:hypothetical protein